MGIVRIETKGAYAVCHCSPALNDLFKRSGSYLDRREGGWVVLTRDVERVTQWLIDKGHAVLNDQPTGPHVQTPLPECACCQVPYRRALLTEGRLQLGDNPTVRCVGPECAGHDHPLTLRQWNNHTHGFQ